MKSFRLASLALTSFVAAAFAAGTVANAQSSTPAPTENPAITRLAKSLLEQAQSGSIDRSKFDAKMNAGLTDDMISRVTSGLKPLGAPKKITFETSGTDSGYKIYTYRIEFDSTTLDELIAIDSNGLIGGWFFKPPGQQPGQSPPPGTQASAAPM